MFGTIVWENWVATCPKCKALTVVAFCRNCNAPLALESEIVSEYNSRSYKMICSQMCGTSTMLKCDTCGATISAENKRWVKPMPSAIDKKARRFAIIVVAIVLFVAFVASHFH